MNPDFANTLKVYAKISSPTGWIDLQDPDNGYELEATSFGERSVSHRKQDVSSAWMEGTYVTRSVRDNVIEQLVVYVTAPDPSVFNLRIKALTDSFDQLSYGMEVWFGIGGQSWKCTIADYTITTNQAFRFATMGVVKASVPRLPSMQLLVGVP